jgi:myo-inositol-1-phosphate synthase
MHRQIGGYRPSDIEVVAAFDIDRRKVGLDVSKAIFSPPNCTKVFCEKIKLTGAIVKMGCVLDGYPPHMQDQDPLRTFLPLEKETTREEIIDRAEEFLCGTDGQLSSRRVRAGHPILCRLRAGSRTRLCQ